VILSDRGVSEKWLYSNVIGVFVYSSFAKHSKSSIKFGILIESAEPREPHHFALLFWLQASAINPYMVNEIIHNQMQDLSLV
jgi:glutamate synthase (ferredoxin)